MALYPRKKRKVWIWKALDHITKKPIAWVVGNRNAKTFRKLFDKVKHLNARYYTDDWEVYQKVLPKQKHVIGKQYTVAIERDNSNTRHYLARMTRRTKVVSKTIEMVDITMRIHHFLAIPENYQTLQNIILAIF